jgi:UDP-N-acetylglucosamine/UDP-N-acetylgalactosamine diphosphorylase
MFGCEGGRFEASELQMTDAEVEPSREVLLELLRPVEQEHLVAFWDQLTSPERRDLARQILAIDFETLRKLREQYGPGALPSDTPTESAWAELAQRAESPPAVRLDGSGLPCSFEDARNLGAKALHDGAVGMILVAGGLGTRLGFDQPKGMFPLGPLSNRPLFQILIDHLRAVGSRYGRAIPLYVMTSDATDAATREFLGANGNFGLADDQLRYFCQGAMWALDTSGQRILMDSPGRLFVGPDGHGGMLAALAKTGCLHDMQQRGLRHIFYGQIDNPLLQVCDPFLLGSHIAARSEATTQVVRKRHPLERVGNVVAVDGRVQVIEYSDLPESVAALTNTDGSLKLWAGNLAVHVFDVQFLATVAAQPNTLPFHVARKKVPCIDERGQLLTPSIPNALRFERFIFDLLPAAKNALVVEADPAEAFAPVKNVEGETSDTPTTSKKAMADQSRRRLQEAGAVVAPNTIVEINPLWALDVGEIQKKLKPGTTIDQSTYFGPNGPSIC